MGCLYFPCLKRHVGISIVLLNDPSEIPKCTEYFPGRQFYMFIEGSIQIEPLATLPHKNILILRNKATNGKSCTSFFCQNILLSMVNTQQENGNLLRVHKQKF